MWTIIANELGEEYKGDKVDEKKKEIKGMKETTQTEESYEGDQIDNRYEGVKGKKVKNGMKRGKRGQSTQIW